MKTKNIKKTIMEYFLNHPTAKLRVREIERTLKAPLPSVIRYCKELSIEGILKIEKVGNIVFYTTDRTNKEYLLKKRLYNLEILYKSGLLEYIKDLISNPPIILFGSFLKGEDIESSDIDLYIETPSVKKIDLKRFEGLLNRKIQIFRSNDIKELKNPHLSNNIINGITLNNRIEVF